MRLTVFGGTSPTGQHLIQQALQAGHTVTALARNPAKLAARDGLTVIEGQLTDTQAVARAVKDADAVISLLGPPSKQVLGRVDVSPILDGYRNIVAAMETHGVRRLSRSARPASPIPPTAGSLCREPGLVPARGAGHTRTMVGGPRRQLPHPRLRPGPHPGHRRSHRRPAHRCRVHLLAQ